jgi:DNA/RNA-binding domain of Phe-tRNA-synthetase-like protein
MNTLLSFKVDDAVLALGLHGVYFVISGLQNSDGNQEFVTLSQSVLATVRHEISSEFIQEDPILRGFRELHDSVGVSNRKHVASPENLLEYVLRTGHIPHVNLIVDIYNLVSIETKLAIGAHNVARINGDIHLKYTTGKESFVPLGSEQKPPRPNVYAYIDDADDILCYLEVRQVEKTKVTVDTTDCFYIVQGNRATSLPRIEDAADHLIDLTTRFCGGSVIKLRTI